jgi:hypothetical protein
VEATDVVEIGGERHPSPAEQQGAPRDTGRDRCHSWPDLESPWIDGHVDPEVIDRRLFDGIGTERSTDAERSLQALDIAVVGNVETHFRRR